MTVGEAFGLTDPGRRRTTNQDHFLIGDLAKSLVVRQTSLADEEHLHTPEELGHVLLVADGMGGHAAGERASALAVETLMDYVVHIMPWFLALSETDGDAETELQTALERCDFVIHEEASRDPSEEGMGTTLTVGYVVGPRLYVVHVGDSRAYLFRDGRLHRMTRDHTMAQQLVDDGTLEEDVAAASRFAHMLTNAVGGTDTGVVADVCRVPLQPDDVLLLTTDGLSRHVTDDAIRSHLRDSETIEDAVRALVDAALEGGGEDNVTVVAARLVGSD